MILDRSRPFRSTVPVVGTLQHTNRMIESDLIFSLGPNCRSTWNLRSHLDVQRAYPFDWWITPARSMLFMIDPAFRMKLSLDDLHVVGNSVYNSRLNILHHHDFPRGHDGTVLPLTVDLVRQCQNKYIRLFERMHADLALSQSPVAVMNGIYTGWPGEHHGVPTMPHLNGSVSCEELADTVRRHLGNHVRLVLVNIGADSLQSYDWGYVITQEDSGKREAPAGAEYAEPVHVFRDAFSRIGLCRVEGLVAQGSSKDIEV